MNMTYLLLACLFCAMIANAGAALLALLYVQELTDAMGRQLDRFLAFIRR